MKLYFIYRETEYNIILIRWSDIRVRFACSRNEEAESKASPVFLVVPALSSIVLVVRNICHPVLGRIIMKLLIENVNDNEKGTCCSALNHLTFVSVRKTFARIR